VEGLLVEKTIIIITKKTRITESHHMSKRHDFVHESLNLSNSCMIICWIFRHQNNNNDDNDINNNDVIGFHNCWKNHWFSLYSSKSSKLLQLQIPVSVIIWYHKCHYKPEHYFSLLLLTTLFRLKIILMFSQQLSLIIEEQLQISCLVSRNPNKNHTLFFLLYFSVPGWVYL